MRDLIYKRVALDAIECTDWYHQNSKGEMVHGANSAEHQAWYKADDIYKAVRDLPSAEPERKTGRWKMEPDPYGFFDEIPVCSECGRTTKMRETYKFCPNCGADMRGNDGKTESD